MGEISRWMAHSMGLAEDMVKFADKYPRRVDRVWLTYARDAQRRVLKAVAQNAVNKLGEADRVWYQYMRSHAEAQVERYAHRMDEATFYARCAELRRERDGKLRAIVQRKRAA